MTRYLMASAELNSANLCSGRTQSRSACHPELVEGSLICAKTHGRSGRKKARRRNLADPRRTRDLLLPKLISGEVDVAELDIEKGEAAA